MKIVKYILLAIISWSFSACSDSDNNSVKPINTNLIMPLAVGNFWSYSDTLFLYGSVSSSKLSIVGQKTIEYQGESQSVYLWTWDASIDSSLREDWYYNNESDGLYCYGCKANGVDTLFKTIYSKFPADVGSEYLSSAVYFGGKYFISENRNIKIVSINKKVATILGDFICYDYQYKDAYLNVIDLYYSKGVGYVGSETRDLNGNLTHSLKLTNYKLM